MFKGKIKILTSGIVGTVLELYDFALYGALSIVISREFFPVNDPAISLLAALGVFAAGFIMRPFGGIIIGHIGDNFGRKKALSLSIVLMAVPTFLIGILPTYNQIGIAAPIILICCRLLQGFCAGGEFNGASIFVIEHAKKSHTGLFGALINSANALGGLFATFVAAIVLLPGLPEWSWRVAFIIGGAIGIVGLYIRRHMSETPEFEKSVKKSLYTKLPLKSAIVDNYRSILCAMGMASCGTAYIYTQLVYMNIYLNKVVGVSLDKSLLVSSTGLLTLVCVTPLTGSLSDKIGRKKVMVFFAMLGFFLVYPIFMLLQIGTIWSIILPQILLGIIVGGYSGPMNAYLTELFPVQNRYSGVTLGFCIGQAIFGGITPFIATFLLNYTNDLLSPAYYLMGCSLIGVTAVLSGVPLISKSGKLPRIKNFGVVQKEVPSQILKRAG